MQGQRFDQFKIVKEEESLHVKHYDRNYYLNISSY